MRELIYLVVGVLGLVEMLVPGAVVNAFTTAAYRDAGEAEPRRWLEIAVRIEGAALVLLGLGGLFRTVRSARAVSADAANGGSTAR